MSSTLLLMAPAADHTQAGHPESYERLRGLRPFLQQHDILDQLSLLSAVPASHQQLTRIHSRSLIDRIRQTSRQGGGLLDHGDTYATTASYDLACLAAGGCCLAVDQILTGQHQNGLAVVRPPGHHAEYSRVSGFCLFNNIAAAARQAQVDHGVERVMIVDYDVHHANGTQDIFYEDDSVLVLSTHLLAPYFYPGTGRLAEIGRENGQGYTLNVPLPPRVGDGGYERILTEVIIPAAERFQPDLILVSAGFDAHWRDPLAMAGLSLTGYARLGQALVELAAAVCNGRILFILEGGYQTDVLHQGLLNLLYTLLGQSHMVDPIGPLPQAEPDITNLLAQLRQHPLLRQSR
jgi:acetoin utilization deacetylase AcuC-like enzyme